MERGAHVQSESPGTGPDYGPEGGGRRAGSEGKASWRRWDPERSFGAWEGFARGRENGLGEGVVGGGGVGEG